jgi:hypothetical protein
MTLTSSLESIKFFVLPDKRAFDVNCQKLKRKSVEEHVDEVREAAERLICKQSPSELFCVNELKSWA